LYLLPYLSIRAFIQTTRHIFYFCNELDFNTRIFKEILLYLDTKNGRNPNFRLPGCVGLLGLPDGFPRQAPLLLQNKTFIYWNVFIGDKMAATTARSIAGSSTLMPPVMLRKTSLAKPETGPFPERLKSY
jgi:hypothetical protein